MFIYFIYRVYSHVMNMITNNIMIFLNLLLIHYYMTNLIHLDRNHRQYLVFLLF